LWSGLRVALTLFALAALGPAPAHAEPPLPALVVTRSAGALDCPDAVQLAAEVARLNGRRSLDASGAGASALRLHVALERDPAGYNAVIRALGARSGERRLTDAGPRCENLAEAVALSLAIILDAREDAREEQRSETPAAATQVAVVGGDPGFERRFVERDPVRSGNALDLAAGIGLHAGALEHAGLLFVGLGRLTLGEFLTLEAGAIVADGQSVAHPSGGELELELAAGFLGVCTRLATDRSRLALTLCAEPYLGRLRGTGSGFDQDLPARDHLWLAGGLALDADGAIAGPARWHVRAAGLVAKKQRFTVTVDGRPDSVFESSSAALLAAAGVRLHFE
jgi:hypothetical protein